MRILPFLPVQSVFLHFGPRSPKTAEQGVCPGRTHLLVSTALKAQRGRLGTAVGQTPSAEVPGKETSISFPLPPVSLLTAPLLPSLDTRARCSLVCHFAGNFGGSPAPLGEGC